MLALEGVFDLIEAATSLRQSAGAVIPSGTYDPSACSHQGAAAWPWTPSQRPGVRQWSPQVLSTRPVEGWTMRLGLLADIHEHLDWLRLALARFRRDGVDQVVFLGDVCCTGERLEATVELLRTASPVGVWGNHDFGLCQGATAGSKYAPAVADFMATLRPRLEVAGCLFTHVEPWLDPTDLGQLWYFEGPPDAPQAAARSFDAWPHRLMFVGHLHRWHVATRAGRLDWDGTRPILLAPPERYLVTIAAVCDGRCAVFDTATNELLPYDLRRG
jgi:hypothetical protein